MLVRQLEEELRMRMRGPSIEMQQQMEAIYQENDHLTREIAILRDTIKVRFNFIKLFDLWILSETCFREVVRLPGWTIISYRLNIN